MKKIAFLLPDFQEGGMPKVASNIMSGLGDSYQQYLILLDSNSDIRFETNAEVLRVCPKGDSKVGKAKVFLDRINIVKKIKKEHHFDIVISFGVAANIINIVSKQNDKTICTEHNIKSIENKTWGFFGRVYDVLIKKFYTKPDHLVAISKVMKEDFIGNYNIKGNIEVIYNPHRISEIINRSYENLTEEEQQLFTDKVTLINVGRMTYAKGHWHLIRILAELKKEIPTIQLIILGQGEMEQSLKTLAERLNVQDSIKFLGFQPNPYKFIRNSDLFVMSSLYEGFPNVLIESLACETPIVSTDCKSGPREIIDEAKDIYKIINKYEVCKYGVLTPQFNGEIVLENTLLSDSEEEMKKAVLKLLSNKELYNKIQQEYKLQALEYDVENMVKEYKKIFN